MLIEAGLVNSDIQLIGFDNNKEHITAAIRNISSAGLIKHIEIKYKDILAAPDLGTFDDHIRSSFGMHISKGEDLEKLYQCFVSYSEKYLNQGDISCLYLRT